MKSALDTSFGHPAMTPITKMTKTKTRRTKWRNFSKESCKSGTAVREEFSQSSSEKIRKEVSVKAPKIRTQSQGFDPYFAVSPSLQIGGHQRELLHWSLQIGVQRQRPESIIVNQVTWADLKLYRISILMILQVWLLNSDTRGRGSEDYDFAEHP